MFMVIERSTSASELAFQESMLRKRFEEQAVLLNPEKGYIDAPWINQEIDTTLLPMAANLLTANVRHLGLEIDKVVAVPTMGTFLGVLVAVNLGLPFMPGRKDGVQPGAWKKIVVIDELIDSFTTGKPATFVFNGLEAGDRVFVVDDFIAHGRTLLTIEAEFRKHGIKVAGIGVYCAKLFQDGVGKLKEIGIDPIYVYGVNMDSGQELYLSPPLAV